VYDSSSDDKPGNYQTSSYCHDLNVLTEEESKEEREESDEEDDYDDESDDNDDDDDDDDTKSNDEGYEGFSSLHSDIAYSHHEKQAIPKKWILLHSNSTVNLFSASRLFANIRNSNKS